MIVIEQLLKVTLILRGVEVWGFLLFFGEPRRLLSMSYIYIRLIDETLE